MCAACPQKLFLRITHAYAEDGLLHWCFCTISKLPAPFHYGGHPCSRDSSHSSTQLWLCLYNRFIPSSAFNSHFLTCHTRQRFLSLTLKFSSILVSNDLCLAPSPTSPFTNFLILGENSLLWPSSLTLLSRVSLHHLPVWMTRWPVNSAPYKLYLTSSHTAGFFFFFKEICLTNS